MTTRAQRINARQDRIYERAMHLKQTQHTPTPWLMQHEFDYEPTYIVPESDKDTEIASTPNYQDAAFIVRACNSHEFLVDALRDVITDLIVCNQELNRDPSANPWIEKARAAITKATSVNQ